MLPLFQNYLFLEQRDGYLSVNQVINFISHERELKVWLKLITWFIIVLVKCLLSSGVLFFYTSNLVYFDAAELDWHSTLNIAFLN
jgi:hypothetical protein